jgi:hypothetical protein
LNQLAGVIPSYEEYANKLRDALAGVEDVAEEVLAVVEDLMQILRLHLTRSNLALTR